MAKKRESPIQTEPEFSRQCVWSSVGLRCQDDGSISTSVHGGGPWYCRDHFFSLKRRGPEDPEVMAPIDVRGDNDRQWSMRCKSFVLDYVRNHMKKPGNRDWARKIVEKQSSGDHVPLIAAQFAAESLPIKSETTPTREPGDDD
jgi:hypothetical protein